MVKTLYTMVVFAIGTLVVHESMAETFFIIQHNTSWHRGFTDEDENDTVDLHQGDTDAFQKTGNLFIMITTKDMYKKSGKRRGVASKKTRQVR